MCFTNDYSKIYVYGIPLFSIRFINVYNRIENFLNFSITHDLFLIALYNYILLLCVYR